MGLSFDTISASGASGAQIHYKPERESCGMINANEIYLCDSGAQYRDGTTDVTRTMHFGVPSERQKECYTRVLQGHIAIDIVQFPMGTSGYALDALARTALWQAGLDYRHGTGHGVGAFLNVHEGPQGIGFRPSLAETGLEAGMSMTNEPGYYEQGHFGMRIENVMLVRNSVPGFCTFERLTMVPIQTKLVKTEMLSSVERDWLNNYNTECKTKVLPLLEPGSLGYEWLRRETNLL